MQYADKIEASRYSENKKQSEKEYLLILAAFLRLVDVYENSAERWEIFEDILTLRSSFLIDRVIKGMNIDFDKALDILKNYNNHSTSLEKQKRDILIAAIDNLIDFSAAQEYAMIEDINKNGTFISENAEILCKRYNLTNAIQENQEVSFAASMASWWLTVSDDTHLTYMTQADERVRAWHLSHEGVTYSKSNFPPELIPPIEWGCRCYLLTNDYSSVRASIDTVRYVEGVNPIFSESLAKGGRIFTDHHPYFQLELPEEVINMKKIIKNKFF